MNSVDFNKLLATKELPNVITFFGEEDFLVFEAYKKFLQKVTSENTTVEIYDFEETKSKDKLHDILLNLESNSLFASRRIVVFKRLESIYTAKQKKDSRHPADILLERILLNMPSSVTSIFISFDSSLFGLSKKLAKASKATDELKKLHFPFNILLANHHWFEFPKLNESQIKKWVKARFEEYGFRPYEEVIETLLNNCNPNLWELSSEIEKISLSLSQSKELTPQHISLVISGMKEENVFQLIKYIARKDIANALVLTEKLMDYQNQQILIVTLLFRFFKNLLILTEESEKIKDNSALARAIGVPVFFFDDYAQGMRNYSQDEILKAINFITQTDLAMKSSSEDPKLLLNLLLYNILN